MERERESERVWTLGPLAMHPVHFLESQSGF